ncbi:DUF1501 domain-containing protein [Sulfitobacter sp. JB4-11]|uniref:DUF1501 domain-containing protein n=1 Tax=Sulfitobacter rhodophyticola TaxID=3238304 RepID=UPI0035182707
MDLSRRDILKRAGIIGCSLTASPLITPVAFAQAPWDMRLVVIILRGGMDGLDVVRPLGDPAFAALRPDMDNANAQDLDGYFALHPALGDLVPLWRAGQLGFMHAVSTPYRDKRSHFDGQDLLEAGTETLDGRTRDGWLNRLLQQMPGLEAETAYAIGTTQLRVLEGDAPVANWTPKARLGLSPQALRLAELVMERDAPLHAALAEAQMLSQIGTGGARRGSAHLEIADFAAKRLRGPSRIAAFSLGGWDTHRAQGRNLPRSLRALSQTLLGLRDGLGEGIWGKTAVLAMTEFGRTAALNGTRGTDHGTGGVMLFAGGALRGGQVLGQWPGVAEAALYDRRDLMPTADVRGPVGWVLRAATGLDSTTIEQKVFPGLQMGRDPGLLG